MAIQLNPTIQTTKNEYRTMAFQVNTPANQDPSLNVYYGEVLYGETGNILITTPSIATLTLTKNQLTGILTGNNPYNLPAFSNLYVGLRGFFDEMFKVHFSGQFPV